MKKSLVSGGGVSASSSSKLKAGGSTSNLTPSMGPDNNLKAKSTVNVYNDDVSLKSFESYSTQILSDEQLDTSQRMGKLDNFSSLGNSMSNSILINMPSITILKESRGDSADVRSVGDIFPEAPAVGTATMTDELLPTEEENRQIQDLVNVILRGSQPSQQLSKHYSSASFSVPVNNATNSFQLQQDDNYNNAINNNNSSNRLLLWSNGVTTESLHDKETRLEAERQEAARLEAIRLKEEYDRLQHEKFAKDFNDKLLMMRAIGLLFSRRFDFQRVLAPYHKQLASMIDNKAGDNSGRQGFMSAFNRELQDAPSSNASSRLQTPMTPQIGGQKPSFLSVSKIKEKLDMLGKFVLDHTNRKIILNWHIVEARFQKSPHFKTVMEKGNNGLLHPVKYRALPLNSLTGLLCSTKIRVGFNELSTLYQPFAVSAEEIFHSRQVAAVKSILGPNNGEGLAQGPILLEELTKLQVNEEKLVCFPEFKAAVFPPDAENRAEEMTRLKLESEKAMNRLIEEKRKKDTMKEIAEARVQKMRSDLIESLATLQNPRGPLSLYRHGLFVKLIQYCEESVASMSVKKDLSVSEDIISLLGIDCFPQFIKVVIEAADASREASKKATSGKSRGKLGGLLGLTGSATSTVETISEEVEEDVIEDTEATDKTSSQAQPSSGLAMTLTSNKSEKLSPSKWKNKLKGASKLVSSVASGGIVAALSKGGFNGKYRIKIQGPPTVVWLLKETVTYGKGLNGMAYRDIVEILQAYCSTRVQATFRGHKRGWRYRAARRKWTVIFNTKKRLFFKEWASLTRHNLDTRNYCWRKLIAWCSYTAQVKKRRTFFRITYWPFYTWRRYSMKEAMAREKAKFLVSRVLPTYHMLIHFRAWKRWIAEEMDIKNRALAYFRSLELKRESVQLIWWMRWVRRRKGLRKGWFRNGGMVMHKRRLFIRMNTPFQIWRMYSYYRQDLRKRMRILAPEFRALIAPNGIPPRPAPNRTAKRRTYEKDRLQAQLDEKKNRKQHEKERRKAMRELKKQGKLVQEDGDADSVGNDMGSKRSSRKIKVVDPVVQERIKLLFRSRTGVPFHWEFNQPLDFDVDSDGEDEENIPDATHNNYRDSITELPGPESFEFLRESDFYVHNKINVMRGKFKFTETWVLLEAAYRYHLFAHRCLQNLRFHAIVTRGARQSQRKYRLKRLQRVFDALVGWMKRDPKYVKNSQQQTEAELLSGEVRSERLGKLMRRRQAAVTVKEIFGRDYDDPNMEDDDVGSLKSFVQPEIIPIFGADGKELNQANINSHAVMDFLRKRNERLTTGSTEAAEDSIAGPSGPLDDVPLNESPTQLQPQDSVSEDNSIATIEVIEDSIEFPDQLDDEDAMVDQMRALDINAVSPIASMLVSSTRPASGNPSTPSEEISKSNQQALEYDAKKIIKPPMKSTVVDISSYKPPNVLYWDREDREVELQLAQKMLEFSRKIRVSISGETGETDESYHEMVEFEKRKDAMVLEVFEMEHQKTELAIANEIKYIGDFKTHAAANLVNVLVRISREVEAALTKAETQKYFRALRMPMLRKRGKMMRNRKQMWNMIRICRRLIAIEKMAPKYHRMRTIWTTFNRWLKYHETESLNPSPGFVAVVKRRCILFPSFNQDLERKGFKKMVYVNSKKLQHEVADKSAVFYRWVMYIQEEKLFKMMEDKAHAARRLKVLRYCFLFLRTGLTVGDMVTQGHEIPRCFPLIRALHDIDQISKRFIAKRKKGISHVMRTYNKKFIYRGQQDARSQLSFRKFLTSFNHGVGTRLVSEQRILVESFEARGTQEYADQQVPDSPSDPLRPAIMTRLDGKWFSDPIVDKRSDRKGSSHLMTPEEHLANSTSFTTNYIPGGFQFRRLRVSFQDSNGIVGWQVIWSADGCRDYESPKRGRWNGAAMTIHDVIIPKDDFAVGVEYLYEGATMLGIRFKLFFGGWTKWAGGKSSLSTLSIFISIHNAHKESFEDEYVSPGPYEDINLGLPRCYIIGFTGLELSARCTSLGLVVRKIREQHIFSYFWVQDAIDKVKARISRGRDMTEADRAASQADDESSSVITAEEGKLPSIQGMEKRLEKQQQALNQQNGGPGTLTAAQLMARVMDGEEVEGYDDAKGLIDDADSDDDPEEDRALKASKLSEKDYFSAPDHAPLSMSEEQFFDIVRMRNTEIKVAQIRVETFARRLWKSPNFRYDPELSRMTCINVVNRLSQWYFESLCKRLVGLVRDEAKGQLMVSKAYTLKVKSEVLQRRSYGVKLAVEALKKEPQSWNKKYLLSPAEREAKMAYLKRVQSMYDEVKSLIFHSEEFKEKSIEVERKGKLLLPRMQLSLELCKMYRTKVSASRNKQMLLEQMDMDTIKDALCGTGGQSSTLSTVAMETIRSSIRNRPKPKDTFYSLDAFIEEELLLAQEVERIEREVHQRNRFVQSTNSRSRTPTKGKNQKSVILSTSAVARKTNSEDDFTPVNKIVIKKKSIKKEGESLLLSSSTSALHSLKKKL